MHKFSITIYITYMQNNIYYIDNKNNPNPTIIWFILFLMRLRATTLLRRTDLTLIIIMTSSA